MSFGRLEKKSWPRLRWIPNSSARKSSARIWSNAFSYLMRRPDYKGKELGVTGGSQGGALTLITAGVDPRVKLAAPNVAAMCDHSGKAHGRVSGWPHWLYRAKDKDKAKQVLETSA